MVCVCVCVYLWYTNCEYFIKNKKKNPFYIIWTLECLSCLEFWSDRNDRVNLYGRCVAASFRRWLIISNSSIFIKITYRIRAAATIYKCFTAFFCFYWKKKLNIFGILFFFFTKSVHTRRFPSYVATVLMIIIWAQI